MTPAASPPLTTRGNTKKHTEKRHFAALQGSNFTTRSSGAFSGGSAAASAKPPHDPNGFSAALAEYAESRSALAGRRPGPRLPENNSFNASGRQYDVIAAWSASAENGAALCLQFVLTRAWTCVFTVFYASCSEFAAMILHAPALHSLHVKRPLLIHFILVCLQAAAAATLAARPSLSASC